MVLLRTTLPVPYKPSAFRLYTLFVPACSPASSAATHLGFLPHLGSSGIMGAVANDVVKHVWIGRANTMDEMIEQCKEPGGGHTLHLRQGARARMMGLHVLGDERATGSRCRKSGMSLTVYPSGITATRLWP